MHIGKLSDLRRYSLIAILVACATHSGISRGADAPVPMPSENPTDFAKQDTVYVVGYAHLDTQWRWSYPQVVNFFLANTLHDNPPLIDKYPHYIFNFTGARRYQLMKEFYPADYERMKAYIKAGRWFPGGSSVDECDQNTPSAESVVRQVLYGNHFFKKEFGVCGVDFMVPDCFGFPYSLPTVLSHCSIKGFNTQKLEWGAASDWWKDHPVGLWQGVDGETVITAFHPTGYGSKIPNDVLNNPDWLKRVADAGKETGVHVDYRYYGTGDRGGAPAESSIANMEKAVTSTGPIRIISATSDQMFRDITPEERAKLPVYSGDLLLTWHSAGSINSQGFMKRLNRKNELLGDAAERASVAAYSRGNSPYPTDKLYRSWLLMLECQMHDILPGDCLPVCYEYSWNDEILASNGFAAAEQDGVSAVASEMDTRAVGVSLVVYNPLSTDRQDPVEATVSFPADAPASVSVTGPDGAACPVQVLGREGANKLKILFLASVAGDSFATFDVRPTDEIPAPIHSPLKVTQNSIENARYLVTLNADGNVAQVHDKSNNTDLLSAPLRLAFLYENPKEFPAWNMEWVDRSRPPEAYVDGPAKVRTVEDGPVRVALEVTRQARDSTFVQRIQLSAGDAGNRVEFPTRINWQSTECSLEAVMPLSVAAPTATYDTSVGVTVRGNNNPRKYEVPQQQWFDVTAPDNHYGVSVLNDCKYGSDKPDDKTVRLTLLYTPGVRGGYQDEASQDFGKHEMVYALSGHTGDWVAGHSVNQAQRLNQPLVPFQTVAHPGALGKKFQLLSVSNPQVVVQALKKAEDSDEIIVRLKETENTAADNVRLTFCSPVVSAHEVDGQEATLGDATINDGALVVGLKPFHLRAYAVKLAAPSEPSRLPVSTPIDLSFNKRVVTSHSDLYDGSFDHDGHTYPAEQFPTELTSEGIGFKLGPTGRGQKNAVACSGQTMAIPAGARRVYVLAASSDGDAPVRFKVGDQPVDVTVQDWSSSIGRWDNRLWKGKISILTYGWSNRLDGLVPGWTKRDNVAWYADHRHDPEKGNEIWQYCYLFKYGFDVPPAATTLTLPNNANVFVFAVSTATGTHDDITPARPLYDTLADHVRDQAPTAVVDSDSLPLAQDKPGYLDSIHVRLQRPLYWQDGYLHYTTDGSDPTLNSPVYQSPLPISQPTTIKACQFNASGAASPVMTQQFEVHDTTPPKVLAAQGLSQSGQVQVSFSEPVTKDSAEAFQNYRFEPSLKVTAAKLQEDGATVILQLADDAATRPTTRPATQLTVSGVRDLSPAANSVRPAAIPVDLFQPLVEIESYSATDGKPPLERKVSGLPSNPTDPWTINCMVRTNRVPADNVLIAGFGTCQDGNSGVGRYLGEFDSNLHYWSCNEDVESTQRLETGRWQMLSAVWNGHTLTLYRDCQPIASGDLTLSSDTDGVVRLAPRDAWGLHHRFTGEIRDFTVWSAALPVPILQALSNSEQHD